MLIPRRRVGRLDALESWLDDHQRCRIAGPLTDALRGSSVPLAVVIDGGCIRSADHRFGTPFDFGVAFRHLEGDIVVGWDRPTRAEALGLGTPEFAALAYAGQKRAVMDEVWGTGFDDADCPWVETDAAGAVMPASEIAARLRAWLGEPDESERTVHWNPHVSEWLPGFEIMRALGADARRRLGLREADIGGPASGSVLAANVGAPAEELDAALAAAGLPFRLRSGGG